MCKISYIDTSLVSHSLTLFHSVSLSSHSPPPPLSWPPLHLHPMYGLAQAENNACHAAGGVGPSNSICIGIGRLIVNSPLPDNGPSNDMYITTYIYMLEYMHKYLR
jgi:hypothetical protein